MMDAEQQQQYSQTANTAPPSTNQAFAMELLAIKQEIAQLKTTIVDSCGTNQGSHCIGPRYSQPNSVQCNGH